MQTFKDVLDHFHDFLEESSYLEVLPCRWGYVRLRQKNFTRCWPMIWKRSWI